MRNSRKKEKIIEQLQIGRPPIWTKEKVLKRLYQVCKKKYMTTKALQKMGLLKLIKKHFGSVREAKFRAKLIQKRMSYIKFLKLMYDHCKNKYVGSRELPKHFITLAEHYCGSVRQAKIECGILKDPRKAKRKIYTIRGGEWNKKRVMECIRDLCRYKYVKSGQFPFWLRFKANHYFGSLRKAKYEAGIVKDMRKRKRAV